MRVAVLVGVLGAVLCGTAGAQNVDKPRVQFVGRVLDLNDEAPIPAAMVRIFALHRVVQADSSGTFSMDRIPPGPQNVEVSRFGYITTKAEIDIAAGDTVAIRLYPQPIILKGIVAVVKKLELRREHAPYQVRAFDEAQLSSATGQDIRSFIATRAMVHFVDCPARTAGGRTPAQELDACIYTRGRVIPVQLSVDEMPVPADLMDMYYADEFVESEYYDGVGMVRLYTKQFMERLARGKASLRPITQ